MSQCASSKWRRSACLDKLELPQQDTLAAHSNDGRTGFSAKAFNVHDPPVQYSKEWQFVRNDFGKIGSHRKHIVDHDQHTAICRYRVTSGQLADEPG
jgi:hypothetical protein